MKHDSRQGFSGQSLPVPRCSFLEDERRDAARKRVPRTIADFLPRILADAKPVLESRVPAGDDPAEDALARVNQHWAETVGPGIAKKTRVMRFRQGVLTVGVEAAPLKQELGFARSQLIPALAEKGLKGLHDIRFQVERRRS